MSAHPHIPPTPLYASPPSGVSARVTPAGQKLAGTGTHEPDPRTRALTTAVEWFVPLPAISGPRIAGPGPQVPPRSPIPPGDKSGAGPGSDVTRGLLRSRRTGRTLLT